MNDNDKTKLEHTISDILSRKINCLVSKFTRNDGQFHHLLADVMKYTEFMDEKNCGFDFDVRTRLFFIGKRWRDFPKCRRDGCGNKVVNRRNITSFTYEYAYPDFCSDECRYHQLDIARRNEERERHITELENRSYDECIAELRSICAKSPTYPHRLIHNDGGETRHLYEFVLENTRFLDDGMTVEPKFNTRLYWLVHGLGEFPKCHHCGHMMNDRNPHSFDSGYPHFCSYECERNATDEELHEYYNTYTDEELSHLDGRGYDELREELLEFVEGHREYSNILKRPRGEKHHLYKFVMDNTDFLDDFYTFKTRVFFIKNGWRDVRRCKECGKEIRKNMRSIYEVFPEYCCAKCAHGKETQNKIKNTLHERYGDEYDCALRLPDSIEKSKNTLLKNYGVELPSYSSVILERTKRTCVEKFGCDSPSESPEIIEKIHETLKVKYGVDCIGSSAEIQEKVKKTNIKRYGCESALANPKVREKGRKTCIERYGVEYAIQNKEFFRKQQKRYSYNGTTFHSSWELAYYIWLTDNNIEFEYQPDVTFEYFVGDKKYIYHPDFLVDGEIIEIKGNQFFKNKNVNEVLINPFDSTEDVKEQSKQECMRNNNVKIISETEIRPYIDYVKNKYGRDYLKSFRNK